MSVYARAVDLLTQVAEPDFHDAFQNPESLRHAFHFCVSLFSLRDWVYAEFSSQPEWTYGEHIGDFQTYLEAQCSQFSIISDVANSAKHLQLNRSRRGVGGADHVALYGAGGISSRPISSMPTLEVLVGDTIYPLLHTAEQVFYMWRKLFEQNNWD